MDEFDVVADSEGEELEYQAGLPRVKPNARRNDVVSSIETAETSASLAGGQKQKPLSGLASSIVTATTSFGASLDALLNTSSVENTSGMTGRPRPRPRPLFRNKERGGGLDSKAASTGLAETTTTTTTTAAAAIDDHQGNDDNGMEFPNILSIADRAKMRQRNASSRLPSSALGQSNSGVLTFAHTFDGEEDELYNSYHAPEGEREEYTSSKVPTKPKPTVNSKRDLLAAIGLEEEPASPPGSTGKVVYEPDPMLPSIQLGPPVHNTPHIPHTPAGGLDTILPLLPAQPTRPKPRPIKRNSKQARSPSAAPAVDQHQPTSQLSIPIATSPLPPSDPPLPSYEEHQEGNGHDNALPPIETLPAPASSPSSLFSVEGDAHIVANRGQKDDPRSMEPPSTFFKGASSLDQPLSYYREPEYYRKHKEEKRAKEKQEKEEKRAQQFKPREEDVIDLCTLPPPKSTEIQIIDIREAPKKAKKTKIVEDEDEFDPAKGRNKSKASKGKRKARDEDDFQGGGDDSNDDYEEGGKRKKAKKKTKEKEKKTKGKKMVEVVVDIPKPNNEAEEVPGSEGELERPMDVCGPAIGGAPCPPPGTPTRSPNNESHLDFGSPISAAPDSEGEGMQDLFSLDEGNSATAGLKSRMMGAAARNAPISKKRRKGMAYDDENDELHIGNIDEKAMSPKKKAKTRGSTTQAEGNKRKVGKVILSDEEEEPEPEPTTKTTSTRKGQRKKKAATVLSEAEAEDESVKENVRPQSSSTSKPTSSSPALKVSSQATSDNGNPATIPKPTDTKPIYTSLTSRYTIAPKTRSTPMSELIRRVNSMPLSPFPAPAQAEGKGTSKSKLPPSTPTPSRSHQSQSQGVVAYSPYLKASRSFLSKIAPLHPNRRTPPPPLPPPPPRKKSKKELELEEKWEEELIESVGGPAAWSCLCEEERKTMKRHKWAVERGEVDD